jgi:hypothetical protein
MIQQESSKRPPFPLILTGNDLLAGHVVYFDGAGWSERPSRARVAIDAAGAEAFEAQSRPARAKSSIPIW